MMRQKWTPLLDGGVKEKAHRCIRPNLLGGEAMGPGDAINESLAPVSSDSLISPVRDVAIFR